MGQTKSKTFKGKKPEIVLVGFEEIGPLGFAVDKYVFRATGKPAYLPLALRMGILAYQRCGNTVQLMEVKAPPPHLQALPTPLPNDRFLPLNLESLHEVDQFLERWSAYIDENTGIRQLTHENSGFNPHAWESMEQHQIRRENLSQQELDLLRSLGLTLTDLQETDGRFSATVSHFQSAPFPFAVDFGGALPTGWQFDRLGLPPKEMRKMNEAFWLAHETAYRTLLQATLHPRQNSPHDFFDAHRLGLYGPTGMGPMVEIERLALASFHGESARPKQLSHCLANTILGYLAPALGFKGKISTHVGACESVMGGFADAVRDIQRGAMDAALVVGYDWSMAATAYNGFIANGAMITNEDLVKGIAKMMELNLIDDPAICEETRRRLAAEKAIDAERTLLQEKIRHGSIDKHQGRAEKQRLAIRQLQCFRALPKKMYRWASMPFNKFRNGFVMSVGAGGGFLTTLDRAVKLGLPIRALVAGMGEKVPDGAGDGYGSIAVLGDGVGDAFEKAFLEARSQYVVQDGKNRKRRPLHINDIGAWWAHGTSTPTNGFGERREIQRILEKYKRNKRHPLCLTGDKEIGHRLGGNFPSEAVFMLEQEVILPFHNYNAADLECDEAFGLTTVVGSAGAGKGTALPLPSDFVAINGAGFGKINSNIILKKFRLDDLNLSAKEKSLYQKKLRDRLKMKGQVEAAVTQGVTPLIGD